MMSLYCAMYDRESETASTGSGSDERLEESLPNVSGYALPLVAHLQHHRAARKTRCLRRELVRSKLRCLEPYLATWRRCLHRVEEEIEDRTMKQVIIANDDQRCRRKQLADGYVVGFVGVRCDEFRRVTGDVHQIQTLHTRDTRPREIEKLGQQP